jgi:hypothetical protein
MNQPTTLFELLADPKPEDYFEAEAWIALSEEYPRNGRRVFVRMSNGSVEMGHWDSVAAKWIYRPFSVGGTPVAWTGLPLPQERSSYKSGVPWLGDLDSSWR